LEKGKSTLEKLGIKMRVLLTGHKGYIGSRLGPFLLENGHDVVGLDSDLFRACDYGKLTLEIDECLKDIRDVEKKDIEGFDAVIHLAGLSNDPIGNLNPVITDEINHKASVRLAMLSKESGVKKFLFASSCSNYGSAKNEFIDEASKLNPLTPYARSKIDAEKGISRLAGNGFCPVFLRSATAFGYSPRIRFDLVLNNLTAWAYSTGLVRLKSDGKAWRPVIHIEDISRAFLSVLNADEEIICNKAFNVGKSSENYRVYELAEIVRKLVPNSKIEFAKEATRDPRSYRVNCDLLPKTIPDYSPSWDVEKGVNELVKSFDRVGLEKDDFEGIKFKRVDHLKMLIRNEHLSPHLRWN
jgi:nucleoside-diphosphate-sugar epimerase